MPRCIVDGREVIVLSSNNYLGLSNHPRLREAAIEAIMSYGVGISRARAIPSGYMVNSGLVPALTEKDDLIISDELNHGSIIDGIRLSRAEKVIYEHRNMEDLERMLNEAEKRSLGYRRILIITDGVFSMDGDIAPLDKIVKLGEEHGAMIYVDDAHGEGVLGDGGRGIVSYFKIDRRKVHVEMGTFSKAFGVFGGHVNGSRDLYNFAYNKSRTWLLVSSLPPAVIAACIAAIDVLENESHHIKRLWDNTDYFKKALENLGFKTVEVRHP